MASSANLGFKNHWLVMKPDIEWQCCSCRWCLVRQLVNLHQELSCIQPSFFVTDLQTLSLCLCSLYRRSRGSGWSLPRRWNQCTAIGWRQWASPHDSSDWLNFWHVNSLLKQRTLAWCFLRNLVLCCYELWHELGERMTDSKNSFKRCSCSPNSILLGKYMVFNSVAFNLAYLF